MITHKIEIEVPAKVAVRVEDAARMLGVESNRFWRHCVAEGLTVMLQKADARKGVMVSKKTV